MSQQCCWCSPQSVVLPACCPPRELSREKWTPSSTRLCPAAVLASMFHPFHASIYLSLRCTLRRVHLGRRRRRQEGRSNHISFGREGPPSKTTRSEFPSRRRSRPCRAFFCWVGGVVLLILGGREGKCHRPEGSTQYKTFAKDLFSISYHSPSQS